MLHKIYYAMHPYTGVRPVAFVPVAQVEPGADEVEELPIFDKRTLFPNSLSAGTLDSGGPGLSQRSTWTPNFFAKEMFVVGRDEYVIWSSS